jgi:DNA replication protein DnaC
MDEEILGWLRYLRLTNLAARWDEYTDRAQKDGLSPVRFLRHVVEEEWRAKRDHARERRLRQARIPEIFRIETYPFDKQPRAPKKRLLAVYDAFEFVEKRQNLIWLGPTGVGKTGLATSFLVEAIERGHTGRYVLFSDLLRELFESVADHSEEKALKQYAAYDCLHVDEIGYAEPEPTRVGLFFALMQRRHRKKPTLVTSNLGFDDWRPFFKNDQLTAALVDKLTEMSHVFNMRGCKSLRAKLPEEP